MQDQDNSSLPGNPTPVTPLDGPAGAPGEMYSAMPGALDYAAASNVIAYLRHQRIWQSVLFSIVIFVAGGASGWGIARLTQIRQDTQAAVNSTLPRPADPPPDPPIEDIVHRMRDELQLSDAQMQQIDVIYRKRFAALQSIRQEMGPQYEQLRVDVQKVLTAEQFAKWNDRFRAMERRILAPPRRPPPRDGPPNDGRPDPMDGPPGGQHDGHNGRSDRPHDGGMPQ